MARRGHAVIPVILLFRPEGRSDKPIRRVDAQQLHCLGKLRDFQREVHAKLLALHCHRQRVVPDERVAGVVNRIDDLCIPFGLLYESDGLHSTAFLAFEHFCITPTSIGKCTMIFS
jgi:hypothetical protein